MSEETNDLLCSCLLLPAGWLILNEVGPAEGEVYGVARQLAWSDGFGWSGHRAEGQTWSPWLHRCFSPPPTYHRWRSPAHVFGFVGVFDPLHLLFVTLPVSGGVLLGLLQRRLQSFDPLRRRPQTLLHFRNLTAEVGVVPHQLTERTERSWEEDEDTDDWERERRINLSLPACELWWAAPGCSPGTRSSVSGQPWFPIPRPSELSEPNTTNKQLHLQQRKYIRFQFVHDVVQRI